MVGARRTAAVVLLVLVRRQVLQLLRRDDAVVVGRSRGRRGTGVLRARRGQGEDAGDPEGEERQPGPIIANTHRSNVASMSRCAGRPVQASLQLQRVHDVGSRRSGFVAFGDERDVSRFARHDRERARSERVTLAAGIGAIDESFQPSVRVSAVVHREHGDLPAVDDRRVLPGDFQLRRRVADREVDHHADASGHRDRDVALQAFRIAFDHDREAAFARGCVRRHRHLVSVTPLGVRADRDFGCFHPDPGTAAACGQRIRKLDAVIGMQRPVGGLHGQVRRVFGHVGDFDDVAVGVARLRACLQRAAATPGPKIRARVPAGEATRTKEAAPTTRPRKTCSTSWSIQIDFECERELRVAAAACVRRPGWSAAACPRAASPWIRPAYTGVRPSAAHVRPASAAHGWSMTAVTAPTDCSGSVM